MQRSLLIIILCYNKLMNKRAVIGTICAIYNLFALQGSALTFAETTGSATFSVDIADTILELTVPSNPAVINLNPTMTGTAFGTANVTISAATNNQTGYTITMTPDSYYSDVALVRTELVGDEEDYRRIEALEPTTPASTGYTEETFTSNTWGYRILNNTNYYGIDENNPTISHPAWTTDAPTNGTTHNLTLATKIDATTVSGSYEATLNFSAVTNAVVAKDTITFDKNSADATGTMADAVIVSGSTANLPANAFTAPTGYRFAGWSTVSSGLGGAVYGDQAPYTAADLGYNRRITLYAQWTPNSMPNPSGGSSSSAGTTFTRAYEIAYTAMHKGMYEEQNEGQGDYALVKSWPPDNEPYKNYDVRFAMQDMTPEICASVTAMHDDYEALDVRDNKLYHITKLQDGNCWMTENLDFNLPSTALSSETTDLTQYDTLRYDSSHGYSQSNGITYWTPACATLPSSSINQNGTATDWDYCNRNIGWGINYAPNSLDLGEWYVDIGASSCDYYKEDVVCDGIKSTPFTNTNGTHGTIGNLYNYAAAVASNDTTELVLETTSSASFDHTTNSICPKGWRLPTMVRGVDSTDSRYEGHHVSYLYNNQTNGSPVYRVGAGRYPSGGISGIGNAYYWYATPSGPASNAGSYYAEVFNFSGGTSWGKGIGNSVRCLAR